MMVVNKKKPLNTLAMSLSPSPLPLTVVVLGFDRVNYFTDEFSEAALVRVQVLFGQLERSVAIWINSTEASTATPNQGVCMCVYLVQYALT